jgi:hypothetical protein
MDNEPAVSDREMLLTIIKALGAIYHHLTGKPLVMTVDSNAGKLTFTTGAEVLGGQEGHSADLPG